MGVIIVEKHLFYIEAQGQMVEPTQPNKYGNIPKPHMQVHLRLRNVRLAWEGDAQRTIGYLDAHQLPRDPGKVGRDLPAMRRFLLGDGYDHPKLLVANVDSPQHLRGKTDMGKYLFELYRVKKRPEWTKTHPVHFGQDAWRDAWLAFDPTQPGKEYPKRDVWLRQAHGLFHNRSFGSELYKGREKKRKKYDQEVVIPIGVAFRIRYFTKRYPLNIAWPQQLQTRVKTYLTHSLGPKSAEWYVIGQFDVPVSLRSMRGKPAAEVRAFMAARMNQSGDRTTKVLRKIFSVNADNYSQAQNAAEEKLRKIIQQPGRRSTGMDFLNAWERGGRKVLTRQRWELYKQRLQARSSRG